MSGNTVVKYFDKKIMDWGIDVTNKIKVLPYIIDDPKPNFLHSF